MAKQRTKRAGAARRDGGAETPERAGDGPRFDERGFPSMLPESFSDTVLAFALAGLGGASLLGAWRLWGAPALPASDVWAVGLASLEAFAVVGALLGLLLAYLWSFVARRSIQLPVDRRNAAIQWTSLPLLLAWFPFGGETEHGRAWTVLWLVFLAGAGGALGAWSQGVGAWRSLQSRRPRLILWVLIGLFAASYAAASIGGFHRLTNASYTDFGGFHNAAWNTLHGRFMWSDHWATATQSGIIWADHLTGFLLVPMLFLLAWPGAETLLVLQAAALALAAWPIYLLAYRETEHRGFALTMGLAMLLSPFIGRIALYEFHVLAFSVLLLSWLLWATRGNCAAWHFWLLGAAALSVREDMAIPVLCVGLWEATFGRRPWRGAVLVAMALAWAVLCINFFMPSAEAGKWIWESGGAGHLDRYQHLGANYGEIVKAIVTRPAETFGLLLEEGKAANYVLLVLAFGLLPLLGWERIWLAVPVFLLHALSNWQMQAELRCQYSAALLPLVAFSAIGGAKRLARWLDRFSGTPVPRPAGQFALQSERPLRVVVALLLGAAVTAHVFATPWRPGPPEPFSPYDGRRHMNIAALPWRGQVWEQAYFHDIFYDMRRIVPNRAAVVVPDACAPHMTARPIVRAFRRFIARPQDDIDYVLYLARVPVYVSAEETQQELQKLLESPDWELLFNYQSTDGYMLAAVFGRPDKTPRQVRSEFAAMTETWAQRPRSVEDVE